MTAGFQQFKPPQHPKHVYVGHYPLSTSHHAPICLSLSSLFTPTTHHHSGGGFIHSLKQRSERKQMASSDRSPGPMTMGQQVVDKGAQLMQYLKPVKQMSQHVCTFAMYSHDMTRQIETHHFLTRLNQDFLQCPVYDSDDSNARLIGVEYIVSEKVFNTLPAEEQKLWHSHAYEIKSGLWVNPRVPEMVQNSEIRDVAKTYGKFWCTWQVDRGDKLPLGVPALMMSPQDVNTGIVKPELVKKRDAKYKISSDNIKNSRANIETPKEMNPYADYWIKTGKGFAVDIEKTPMELRAPFP